MPHRETPAGHIRKNLWKGDKNQPGAGRDIHPETGTGGKDDDAREQRHASIDGDDPDAGAASARYAARRTFLSRQAVSPGRSAGRGNRFTA